MRSQSILRYGALAYGITWVLTLPLVLQGLGMIPPVVSPHWHGLGALGPACAAFLMRRSADPSVRLRDLYARKRAGGISQMWTRILLLSPLLLLGVGLLGVSAFGETTDYTRLADALSRPEWLASLLVGSVFYGLGEEPGWRGWLLDRLQRERGAVTSTLFLAVIWAGWHAPFFAYRFDFGAGTVVGFFIGLLAGAFWLTFLFNSSGGSVWTVALWHVIWNVSNIVAAEISVTVVAVLNALMIVLGFGVVALWGRRNLTVGGVSSKSRGPVA